ncbi:hypothetical protein [Cryobacterium sp.]|uniref:hypothetical protein n=1 Tax=Cryobacterium sp. TaxID=1926290 RepID=UPI0026214229|nr:hypothetical protein [Cryobacterium sp.]
MSTRRASGRRILGPVSTGVLGVAASVLPVRHTGDWADRTITADIDREGTT